MAITGAGLRAMRSIPSFGTIGAIAEIVDNSIQWKSDTKLFVDIVLIERQGAVDEIMIIDNGIGMGTDAEGKEIIDYCLVFGGGTNLNATSNLGKFGIGLPYACCSQSEEYHIYSWKDPGMVKHKMRDHSDFGDAEMVVDRDMELLDSLPIEISKFNDDIGTYDSGTVVQWKNCDRLTYKKSSTIINHSKKELGRIYRNYIGDEIEIRYRVFKDPQRHPRMDPDLSQKVEKRDFLFTAERNGLFEPYNNLPPSEEFCPDQEISYIDEKGIEHTIKVSYSLAKKEIQLPNCTSGGNTLIGREYAKTAPISLVRAGRELRNYHFNYLFKNGINDPRHRWLKIEAKFEPISDELLGVNANKTDAQHFRYIDDDDVSDVDYLKLRHKIAACIQTKIKEMWEVMQTRVKDCKSLPPFARCPKCSQETYRNNRCENVNCNFVQEVCDKHGFPIGERGCPVCNNTIKTSDRICPIHRIRLELVDEKLVCPTCEDTPPLSEDEVAELKSMLRSFREFEDAGDDEMEMLIDWFVRSNKKHFIVFITNAGNKDVFMELKEFQRKIDLILVNKNHPYYENQIQPLYEIISEGKEIEGFDAESALDSILLFLIAWSETEKISTNDKRPISRFRNRFGIQLNEVLEVWSHLNE